MKFQKFLYSFFLAAFLFQGCRFFSSVEEEITGERDYDSEITSVTFDHDIMSIYEEDSDILTVSLNPSSSQGKCNVSWEWEEDRLDVKYDNFSAIITPKPDSAGGTYIKAKCNGIVATCMITILARGDVAAENPYIYSDTSVVEMKSGSYASVSAGLYGGTSNDMELFEWSVKNTEIADIAAARNNCVITAKKSGSTVITVSHPDADYDYTFIVFVYTDKLTSPYITTQYNVISLDKNTDSNGRLIEVDMKNPVRDNYSSLFEWNFSDEKSRQIIEIDGQGPSASIIPLSHGTAKITVSHPDSEYPLEITVRVTTIVRNVYISLSDSTLVVTGSDDYYSVSAEIKNYDGIIDTSKFVFTVNDPDGTAGECMDVIVNDGMFTVLGKKNGKFKVTVSHELSELSRSFTVILQQQAGSAVNASKYITTSDNYIRTQVGSDSSTVTVTLMGGTQEDLKNIKWYVKDGNDNGIVDVIMHDGTLESRAASTTGLSSMVQASLTFEPVAPGEVTVNVGCDGFLYETEIMIKVYSEYALLEDPVMIDTDCTSSYLKLLNGEEKTITASLRNASAGDENYVSWSSSDVNLVSVNPEVGRASVIRAGNGTGQSYVTADFDHDGKSALAPVKLLVMTAATQEELDAMKAFCSDVAYIRLTAGDTEDVSLQTIGLSETDRISWSVDDSSICSVIPSSGSANLSAATLEAFSAGITTLTASLEGCPDVQIEVTVLPEGESAEVISVPKYFTTTMNAVVIENSGDYADLSVDAINFSAEEKSGIIWQSEDVKSQTDDDASPVFDVSYSGTSATIMANKAGKSVISVSSPVSQNTLKINAKCGSLLEWTDGYYPYIVIEDNNVVNLVSEGEEEIVYAYVVNAESAANNKFSFSVAEGPDVVSVTGVTTKDASGVTFGQCSIKPLSPGQARIIVKSTVTGDDETEIFVNVANTEEELKGFRYITTEQNVVTISEGGKVTVSVEMENADEVILSGYSWKPEDDSICSVTESSNVAVIYGDKCGSTVVTVSNPSHSDYPLDIIVNVVDPIAAADDPYISVANIINCTAGESVRISAELIGGSETDDTGFIWSTVSDNITLYGNNSAAEIKGLKEGVAQISVEHTRKGVIARTVLVIVEPAVTTNCYISLSSSIVKMSPDDSETIISAELINGSDGDEYDFKWWADDYDIIDMDYSAGSCMITPLASGTVTVHVSHPKAGGSSSAKEILLYISRYSEFAFEEDHVTISAVNTTDYVEFINMEVPAVSTDYFIKYAVTNARDGSGNEIDESEVCTVSGTGDVCMISPKYTGSGAATCTVTAEMYGKNNVSLAKKAELLVAVQKIKDVTPYVALTSSSSVITLTKGDTKTLSAKVFNTSDSYDNSLQWTIGEEGRNVISIKTSVDGSGKGSAVTFSAVNSGSAVVKISCPAAEDVQEATVLFVVTGESSPEVAIDESLNLITGEDPYVMNASVLNCDDHDYDIEWKVSGSCIGISASANICTVTPKDTGTATITCTVRDVDSKIELCSAICDVSVSELPYVRLFTLGSDGVTRNYLSQILVYPEQTVDVLYETLDNEAVKTTTSDSRHIVVNNRGFGAKSISSKITYGKDVGLLEITGTDNEGDITLTVTASQSQSVTSVSVKNGYSYVLSVDTTSVNSTPAVSSYTFSYDLAPASCELLLFFDKEFEGKMTVCGAEREETSDADGQVAYRLDKSRMTKDENFAGNGMLHGSFTIKTSGELKTTLDLYSQLEETNPSNGELVITPVKNLVIPFTVAFPSHSFTPVISSRKSLVLLDDDKPYMPCDSDYSKVDNKALIIGDGECCTVTVRTDPSGNVSGDDSIIKDVTFTKKSNADARTDSKKNSQKDHMEENTADTSLLDNQIYLQHEYDYGYFYYTAEDGYSRIIRAGEGPKASDFFEFSDVERAAEERNNTTLRYKTLAGQLNVTYMDYSKGSNRTSTAVIPVYVEVRNCPSSMNDSYGYFESKIDPGALDAQ